jgi:hypothetical protein
MKQAALATLLGAGLLVTCTTGTALAAPTNSHSPNVEGTFPVVCDGATYTLLDAPAAGDHADFTPAFVVGTNRVVIPYAFDATQSVTVLSDGAVFDGVTYNAGDVLFTGSESQSIGTSRTGGRTCTFGGSAVESFTDDNGVMVDVEFNFQGTAQAIFPNSR